MKTIYLLLTLATLGTAIFSGCAKQTQEPQASQQSNTKFVSIAAIRKTKNATPVVAHGIMVEKCPIAGCWFKLHDKTGTIKVDLKATKQTVLDVPLNSEVTVNGKVVPDGSEKMIQAASATF